MEHQKPAVPPEHRRHIGMRIVKTVIAVFVCGVLAWARGQSGFYSMIAAVVCVQNTAGKTIESSINRMIGTLIGGVADESWDAFVAVFDGMNVDEYLSVFQSAIDSMEIE